MNEQLFVLGAVSILLFVFGRWNVGWYAVLLAASEVELWMLGWQDNVPARLFQAFLLSLLGLVAFLGKPKTNDHPSFWQLMRSPKLIVITLGALVMSLLFVSQYAFEGLLEHFLGHEHHAEERRHILFNLALLIPGFTMVAWYFEKSGACSWIERRLQSDGQLLHALFCLSAVLDNIATAMLGGSIVMARYGGVIQHCRKTKTPLPAWLFQLIIGVVASSNLGGAASAFGDTTTVMIFISGVEFWELSKGLIGAAVAQFFLVKLFVFSHREMPQDYDHLAFGKQEPILWTNADAVREFFRILQLFLPWNWGKLLIAISSGWKLYPLLGIPGLCLGNIFYDQAGIGLLAGLALGWILGEIVAMMRGEGHLGFSWTECSHSLPGTIFLLLLVYAAKLLPLDVLRPMMEEHFTRDQLAIVLGLLSPIFDNIPLTSLAIDIDGFQWSLLALTVGYGGSMLWLGSSAGVALAKMFPEITNTGDWFIQPIFKLFVIFWIMCGAHLLIWTWIPQLFGYLT